MNIIEYERATTGDIDYAPEGYLDQGMARIINNIHRDQRRMAQPYYGTYVQRVMERIRMVENGYWVEIY